mgnify:CR=1 FL=1
MDNFYDVLQKIQKRPAMYLGRHSIFSLQAFLDGYYFARRELGVPLTKQEAEFQDFLQWLRQKFRWKRDNYGQVSCFSIPQMNAVQSSDFLACLKSLSIGKKLKKLMINGLRVVGFCEI